MQQYPIVEQNLRAAMGNFSNVCEAGHVRDLPGVFVVASGLDIGVFNAALLSAPATLAELERRINVASIHFSLQGLPWSFWLCEDLIPKDEARKGRTIFLDRGFQIVSEPIGMYAESLNEPQQTSGSFVCKRVIDSPTRQAFCDITSIVFDIPFETSRRIYDSEAMWQEPVRGYIGYLDGKPVSTTMIIVAHGAIGVYSVGTLPQHQRRGYGETVVRHAVTQTSKSYGVRRSVLQSTRAGLALYRKLGYQAVTRFTIYVAP